MATRDVILSIGSGPDQPASKGKMQVKRVYTGPDGDGVLIYDTAEVVEWDGQPATKPLEVGQYYVFTPVDPTGDPITASIPAGVGSILISELVPVNPRTLEPSAEAPPAWFVDLQLVQAELAAKQNAADLDADTALILDTPGSELEGSVAAKNASGIAGLDYLPDMTPETAVATKLDKRNPLPNIISLITGTEDESFSVSQCTVAADTVNYKIGGRGWKMSISGAKSFAYLLMSPIPPQTSGPLPIRPFQAVVAEVYIPDASKVTLIQAEVSQDAGNTIYWQRATTDAPTQTLVNGWNKLRWKFVEGMPVGWDATTINRVRIYASTNASADITIGHVYVETPPKARILFIEDSGYKSFAVRGVPDLRRLKVPITWAIDITKLGDHLGEFPDGAVPYGERITEADVAQFASEGDEISFHGWDGAVTGTMTDAEYRADTIKCIKWLQARGYKGRMWRAANVQNLATASAIIATSGLLLGNSQRTTPSVRLTAWPPINIQNIPRWSFYGSADSVQDDYFSRLQRTNGLMVVYNHGIGTGYFNDATQAEWDYFVSKVEAGIEDGWLEPVTFSQLWAENGGEYGVFTGDLTKKILSNVDNTADAVKPVSTPQQAALNQKASTALVGQGMETGLWYAVPCATTNTAIPAEGVERAARMVVGRDCTIDQIAVSCTVIGGTGALVRLGIRADGAGDKPGALLADGGTVAATATGALSVTLGTPLVVTAGTVLWVTCCVQGAATPRPTIRHILAPSEALGDSTAAGVIDSVLCGATSTGSTTGALPSTQTWTRALATVRSAVHCV